MIRAQGISPRLESGAVLLFLDPAGLNFAIRSDYFSGVACLAACDRGWRKYASSASADPSKKPASNCLSARSRIVSRLILGLYRNDRPGLRRVAQPRFSRRSKSVITVVYASTRSVESTRRASWTVPSPSCHSALRQASSSGGGRSCFAAGRLKTFRQVRRAAWLRNPNSYRLREDSAWPPASRP